MFGCVKLRKSAFRLAGKLASASRSLGSLMSAHRSMPASPSSSVAIMACRQAPSRLALRPPHTTFRPARCGMCGGSER
jgi:hypothetical protein